MRALPSVFSALGMLPCVFVLGEVRDEDIADIALRMIAGIRSLHERFCRLILHYQQFEDGVWILGGTKNHVKTNKLPKPTSWKTACE